MINGDEYTQFKDYKILTSMAAFFKPEQRGFCSLGVGTFAHIGKIHGILTCAHVLEAISKEQEINVAIFPVRETYRLIPLNIKDHCDYIKFGPSGNHEGPDLGFLRLPIPFVDSISHLFSSKSLELGRDNAFAQAEPSDKSVTVVVGMISEWTPEVQQTTPFVASGLMGIGEIDDRRNIADYDLFRFRPVPDENFRPPSSYAGTSGGGLWRVYHPQPDDGSEIAYRLIGVAFYETGDGQIICHGQASVYVKLFDAIHEKWPDARTSVHSTSFTCPS